MAGIYNCDWLSATLDFERYNPQDNPDDVLNTLDPDQNKHLARLFAALDEQRGRQDGNGFIDLGLFKLRVYPHGNRSYYYLMECDDIELYLMRWRSKKDDNYPVYVHIKSQWLWSDMYGCVTLADKFALLVTWLEDVLNGKYKASKINRLDLCYHTDQMPDGYTADQYVGKHTLDDTMRTHRLVSAINIGSRRSERLYYRSYNKYLEVRAKRKEWFYEVWMAAGLNVRQVWNCEYQMAREFFTDTEIAGRKLDAVEDIIKHQATIWRYLTHEWLTYRVPDNERRSRWSLHPWWEQLQAYSESGVQISRGRQRELPTTNAIVPPLIGFLTAYAARKGDSMDGTLFDRLRADIEAYAERTGIDLEQRVSQKRMLMDPEDETDADRDRRLIDAANNELGADKKTPRTRRPVDPLL